MRLDFPYSIVALPFIGIIWPPYPVGSDMSLRSTMLTIRPCDMAGMNWSAIVSSIGWKIQEYQELFEENT